MRISQTEPATRRLRRWYGMRHAREGYSACNQRQYQPTVHLFPVGQQICLRIILVK